MLSEVYGEKYTSQGQTINRAYNVETLKRSPEAVHRKRPELRLTIGFSAMTTIQLTRRSLSSSFYPKNRLLKWNAHFIP
jgi:hypothetical protein